MSEWDEWCKVDASPPERKVQPWPDSVRTWHEHDGSAEGPAVCDFQSKWWVVTIKALSVASWHEGRKRGEQVDMHVSEAAMANEIAWGVVCGWRAATHDEIMAAGRRPQMVDSTAWEPTGKDCFYGEAGRE